MEREREVVTSNDKPRVVAHRYIIEAVSSLQVKKTTYSGLKEHRIIEYTAKGQKSKPQECMMVLAIGY
jgi:hypothetical protein